MKPISGFLCGLLILAAVSLNFAAEEEDVEPFNELAQPMEQLFHVNFLKVMSALMVRKNPIPADLKKAVKTVMRELLNGQPRDAGYWPYLQSTMLSMADKQTAVQMETMLQVMEEKSPSDSIMAKAAAAVRNWFQSEAGQEFLEKISIYVKNLFHKNRKFLPKIPDQQASSEPEKQKPSTLPADVEGIENEVARNSIGNRLPGSFKKIGGGGGGGKVVVVVGGGDGGVERRPGGRPGQGRPGDRDRYPGNRPGNGDRYPEGGNHGHYPDERPHYPRPGGGNYPDDRPHNHPGGNYPDDRPHNRPRPGGNYPEDRPRPGQPGHYPEDRPHNHPRPGGGGDYYPERYPDRPHGKPSVDKVCIERVPTKEYHPRASRSLNQDQQ